MPMIRLFTLLRPSGKVRIPRSAYFCLATAAGLAWWWLLYHAAVLLSLAAFPLPIERLDQRYSTVHLGSRGELLRISLSGDDAYRIRLRLDDISPDLVRGFLRYEDAGFYRHPGVDPLALVRAAAANVRAGRVVSGGSTITMQIAKLMEPKRRTIGAKIIEALRAIQLEERYSKRQLLELYLNLVPMGGNIEGVGAAAYLYFGKPAACLSAGECALLIGIPKSPNRYRPDRRGAEAAGQRDLVLRRVAASLGLTPAELGEAQSMTVPGGRRANPMELPELVQRTRQLGPSFCKTYTVDMELQRFCRGLLEGTMAKFRPNNCHNGALIVVDNRTMEVLAYVGSADFRDSVHCGQINCANISRSPGSLLKPFLYALGVERGLITPRTALYDIAMDFEGYRPANFNRRYLGPVTARDALINSMNVPAVNLEYQLGRDGLPAFIDRTKLGGACRREVDPGLSLVLGAYPLTLEELVRLYAALANGGKLRQLKFFAGDLNPNEGFEILSSVACYVVSYMLTEIERPDLPQSWEFTYNRGRIAFKTGTSFGLKDAWCIGYNPDYTVGVWLGNADCQSSDVLVGIRAAAPVTVAVLNRLTRYRDSWFARPPDVAERTVCAVSGALPGPCCEQTTTDLYLPGISSMEPCRIHRLVWIRKLDECEVCRYCMNGRSAEYRSETAEVWPPEVSAYLRSTGRLKGKIPRHNPLCQALAAGSDLKIASPRRGGFYQLDPKLTKDEQRIMLKAEASTPADTVFWFLDDRLVFRGSPDRVFFIAAEPGTHTVRLTDFRGRSQAVTFKVRKGV